MEAVAPYTGGAATLLTSDPAYRAPRLTRGQALERLHEITLGIDKDEIEHPDGWWETSGGLAFGISVLQELESLIIELTDE